VTVVVAVDFGATSIRVARVDLSARPVVVDIVHRAAHAPVPDAEGHLRWDWPRLLAELDRGLDLATAVGPVASIGVDTWGVDYGLLDDDGALVAPPYSYRDHRTDTYTATLDAIGAAELYAMTGVQVQPFNTIFQLAVHRRDELARAARLLLLPELIVHHLTGVVTAERSSAGTTGLVDLDLDDWSRALLAAIGVRHDLLPARRRAGEAVGEWRGVPVHLVGGHDTASAVVGMGPATGDGVAFVATGTWLLVGREQADADRSEGSRLANLTNEPGALGGFRHLRNVAGFWLMEQCRPSWGDVAVTDLVAAAAALAVDASALPAFDATDPRFLHPDDMLGEVTDALGIDRSSPAPFVTRCIIESMARTTADVLDHLGGIRSINLFGGAARIDLLRERLAEVAGVPVAVGPAEAAAVGNALVQGLALGAFADLADARAALAPAGGVGAGSTR